MSVKRHTSYNLVGSMASMVVSMIAVPIFLHRIGEARYGVLALVWGFMGYFGLFDPGITRAASFHIARLHGPENDKERESVFWTAIAVNLAFGLVGGLVLYVIARPLFMTTFKMPADMRLEVLACLPWLAASIPVSTVGGVLNGTLATREWFGLYNLFGFLNNVFAQIAPLLVVFLHGPDLSWLIPSILLSRAIGTIPVWFALARAMPLGVGGQFDRAHAKPLFAYGGWITISNLLNPIMTTMDRMLIGSTVSAQAVAFYTVPFNLISRVSVLPGALASSVFPKLSRGTADESSRLASEAVAGLAAVMTPLMVGIAAAIPIFMQLWVGKSFSQHAAPVALILIFGVWMSGLSYIALGHLHASNRPDVVAKFHAYEVVPFLGALWLGLHFFGLVGAAWATTIRMTADAVLLFAVAGRIPGWVRIIPGGVMIILSCLFSPYTFLSLKTPIDLFILIASCFWAWNLSPSVRVIIRTGLARKVLRGTA